MFYELTKLGGPLLKMAEMDSAAQEWMAQADVGTVLGRWRTDIGPLGQVFLLRGFATSEALAEERRRALMSRDPFNGNDLVETLEMESYEGFPFLPSVSAKTLGGIYEFRTYVLKPGGLPPTLDGWKAAIAPAKDYTDHLVINMFALDGQLRITHIWGFESLAQRSDLRNRHYAAGVWPPKGGPENIDHATSTIALSNEGSPLN